MEDWTEDMERCFHDKIYEKIEEWITDDEELTPYVLDYMNDEYSVSTSIKEVGDLGDVHIQISQENIEKAEEKK